METLRNLGTGQGHDSTVEVTAPQALALHCVKIGDPYHGVVVGKIRPLTARSKVLRRMIDAGHVLAKEGTTELYLTPSGEVALSVAIAHGKVV